MQIEELTEIFYNSLTEKNEKEIINILSGLFNAVLNDKDILQYVIKNVFSAINLSNVTELNNDIYNLTDLLLQFSLSTIALDVIDSSQNENVITLKLIDNSVYEIIVTKKQDNNKI